MRTKFNVEYPLAKTLAEAIAFMKAGGEVWQEISDDFPSCGGFDDIDCLKENFPEGDYDLHQDIQDHYLHLCPANRDEDYAEPFRVGEQVWATEQFFPTNDIYMHSGDSHKIVEINDDGTAFKLDVPNTEWKDVWWSADKFCRCVLPVNLKKVYICQDVHSSSMGVENAGVYEDLNFLKEECHNDCEWDILWSDEHEDFEEKLEELGILGNYSGSNWDVEAIDKATGNLLFGIEESLLRTQYS